MQILALNFTEKGVGTYLRAFYFCRELARAGHEVTLATVSRAFAFSARNFLQTGLARRVERTTRRRAVDSADRRARVGQPRAAWHGLGASGHLGTHTRIGDGPLRRGLRLRVSTECFLARVSHAESKTLCVLLGLVRLVRWQLELVSRMENSASHRFLS